MVFGAATILLLPLLSAGIGRTAVVTAAMLMALSPAMVFYSRMYIQEALFACFALAFVIGVGRVATGGGLAWTVVTGLAAGLAIATKETAAIVLPAALVARRDCLVVARIRAAAERADRRPLAAGGPRQPHRRRSRRGALLFVVLHRAGSHARTVPCGGHLSRSRDRSIQPHPALALLPATAHVLRVRRPPLERGTGPRARRCSARSRPGADRTALLPAPVSGRATSLATSSLPARSSRRFPTRRPGTCCRSMPARSRSPGSGSRRS